MQKRPVVCDIFSGIGGFCVGLESVGCDIKYAVEINPVQAAVHKYNFPYGKIFCSDVRDFKGEQITEAVDILTGGSPCQGLSSIGKQNPQDERNLLMYEFPRLLGEIKPKYGVFENVPLLASAKNKSFLERLVQEIELQGYQVVKPWKILNGINFGGPQQRRRLFLLCYRNDVNPMQYPVEQEPGVVVSDVIADLAQIEPYIGEDLGIDSSLLKDPYNFDYCHQRSSLDGLVYGHLCSQHTAPVRQRFQATAPGTRERVSRFHKLHPQQFCLTQRAGTGLSHGAHTSPRAIHYQHPRCISIREAALLQTIPLWFELHRTIWSGHMGIGNSVMPLVAQAIGKEIIQALGIDATKLPISKLDPQDPNLLKLNYTEAYRYLCYN